MNKVLLALLASITCINLQASQQEKRPFIQKDEQRTTQQPQTPHVIVFVVANLSQNELQKLLEARFRSARVPRSMSTPKPNGSMPIRGIKSSKIEELPDE